MQRLTHLLLLLALGRPAVDASSCGTAAVPFSFEALPNGQPVLGCARPACFGWSSSGDALAHNGNFYRIAQHADGYLRRADSAGPNLSGKKADYYQPQQATCDQSFESADCSGEDQWVGGIAPLLNVSELPVVLQCCKYPLLRLASERGVAVVKPGQIVMGGEVLNNGRQYAFDYIADILKHINEDGSVTYDVSMRRMPCLPFVDFSTHVERSTREEILGQLRDRVKQAKTDAKTKFVGESAVMFPPTRESTEQIQHVASTPIQAQDAPAQPQQVANAPNIIEGPFMAEGESVPNQPVWNAAPQEPQQLLQPQQPQQQQQQQQQLLLQPQPQQQQQPTVDTQNYPYYPLPMPQAPFSQFPASNYPGGFPQA